MSPRWLGLFGVFVLAFGACTPQTSPPPADVTLAAPTTAGASTQVNASPPPQPTTSEAPPDPEPAASDTSTSPPPTPPATPTISVNTSTWSPALDPRTNRPRAPSLLTTELQALKRLLAATSQSASDRPALLRRLAADSVELRKAGVASASADAIAYYEQLLREYPNEPNADEDRYYLGLEALLANDMMKARMTFYALIKNSPSSKYVPYAYFAFGEAFFKDGKLDFAAPVYTEVLKFAQSPIAPEAALELYRVAKAKGDATLASKMRALLNSQYATSAAAARARAQSP